MNLFKIIVVITKNLIANIEEWNWRKSVRDIFTQDIKTKSIVFLFTALFFYYVNLQDIEQKSFFIPLKIEKTEELTLVNEIPESITLSLRGNKDNLINLDVNNIFAEIAIPNSEEGMLTRIPQVKGIPQGVQILGISPNEIELQVSFLHKKIIRIEPEFTGRLPRSLILDQYTISPKRLDILAPKDILEDLTSLKTEPIDISNIKSNKEIEVALNKNIHPSIVIDQDRKFLVSLLVEKRIQNKTVTGNYFITIENLDSNLFIDQDYYVEKIFYQVRDRNNNFDFNSEFLFSINAENIKEAGNYELKIEFNDPNDDVKITKVEPSSINLEIKSFD